MITYVKGDLLETPHEIIVHGCNAQGVMGSGVAKAIRDKYPEAFEAYRKECDSENDKEALLGRVIPVVVNDHKLVVNAITQMNYGGGGQCYVSYIAIDIVMQSLSLLEKNEPICMPKIGAGLGGGDWKKIEQIINDRLGEHDVRVYIL